MTHFIKGAIMHGHACIDCGHLRICLLRDCPIRATEREAHFTCGCLAPQDVLPIPAISK